MMDIPPPLKLIRPSQADRTYTLNVVQNPLRARCCGFGQKDRRPIDPPPIVELIAKDQNGRLIELKPDDSFLYIIQCELYSEDTLEQRTVIQMPWTIPPTDEDGDGPEYTPLDSADTVRNLIGSTVSNAYHLYNEHKRPGVYFIFNDLSVRLKGEYTLKFSLIDLAAGEPLTMSTFVQQEAFSAPFTVYSAKKFPGLSESTDLSKCFSRQGIKIPLRSDVIIPKRKPDKNIL